MKKVKMITKYAGPNGTCAPGKTIDVENKEAKALVDGGYATYVDQPKEKKEDQKEGQDQGKELLELRVEAKELGIENADEKDAATLIEEITAKKSE